MTKKLNESYVTEVDGDKTLNLVNHLVFITKDEVTISSLYGIFVDITLTKIDVLKVSRFISENYPKFSTLKLENAEFEISKEWIVIKSGCKKIQIRPEMFEKVIIHIEEREKKIMEGSNATQEVYNKIINATTNQNNNKPSEAKSITTGQMQIKKTIYDTVIDTIEKTNLGGNKNGK